MSIRSDANQELIFVHSCFTYNFGWVLQTAAECALPKVQLRSPVDSASILAFLLHLALIGLPLGLPFR